jgi:hypothetical protein
MLFGNRWRPQGKNDIAVSRVICAPPSAVYAFLAERDNHCLLTEGRIEVCEFENRTQGWSGALLVIRGPLGLRLRARTRLDSVSPAASIVGTAQLGARTTVRVRWDLRALDGHRTLVRLSAAIAALGPLDRLLLLAGGKRWIRRLFATTLELLAAHLETDPGEPRPTHPTGRQIDPRKRCHALRQTGTSQIERPSS